MKKLISRLFNLIQFNKNSVLPAIVITTVLAYGLLVPWLGFYWDDWAFAWIFHALGPKEFIPAFIPFRPLLGPIFMVTSSLLGASPLAWQIFGLLVRVLAGFSLYWMLDNLWPQHSRQNLGITFLFLVFPGYEQQWVAFTHTNQEWLSLIALILSFGLTIKAVRGKATPVVIGGALFLQLVGLLSTEYFFGLEAVRPFLIWLALDQAQPDWRARLIKTVRIWFSSYFILWMLSGVAYILYYRSGLYHSYEVKAQTLAVLSVVGIFNEIINTLATAGFASWARTFSIIAGPFLTKTNWLVLALTLGSLGVFFLYLNNFRTDADEAGPADNWGRDAIMLGLIGLLAGRLPSWAAGFPASFDYDFDRLMISMMLGASIMIIGLIDFFVKQPRRKIFLISLLVALAIGQQFLLANTYRRDWQNQRTFFWQLAWRMPDLKPGTALVTHELPFDYESDRQLSAPLNWIYAQTPGSSQLPYMFLYTKNRLGTPELPALQKDLPLKVVYRTQAFQGSTSAVVVFYYSTDGCLRVLDPVDAPQETVPGLTYKLTDAIPLSNLTRISDSANPPVLPEVLFGREPAHTWCYYYLKAELARQDKDWAHVSELHDAAIAQGYSPLQPAENIVFIQAYLNLNKLDLAEELTATTLQNQPELCPALLKVWRPFADVGTATEQIAAMEKIPGCKNQP